MRSWMSATRSLVSLALQALSEIAASRRRSRAAQTSRCKGPAAVRVDQSSSGLTTRPLLPLVEWWFTATLPAVSLTTAGSLFLRNRRSISGKRRNRASCRGRPARRPHGRSASARVALIFILQAKPRRRHWCLANSALWLNRGTARGAGFWSDRRSRSLASCGRSTLNERGAGFRCPMTHPRTRRAA